VSALDCVGEVFQQTLTASMLTIISINVMMFGGLFASYFAIAKATESSFKVCCPLFIMFWIATCQKAKNIITIYQLK